MNNFITRLSLMLLCITYLASCTVYKNPVTYSYIDINTGVKAGRDIDVSAWQPSVPASGVKVVTDNLKRLKNVMNEDDLEVTKSTAITASGPKVEVCARLILPNHAPLPRLTEQQMEEMSKLTLDKFNSSLLTHMKSMYRYSKIEQAQEAEAYRKHVATCRITVVQ